MEYIKRDLERKFLHMSSAFKAVMVVGARQVGKSTMLKHLAEGQNRTYVTMDDTQLRNFAQTEPKLFLQTFQPPILIDEVQKAPELFEEIKIICDSSDERGQFWLTGSQSRKMVKKAGDSLAGRLCILKMYSLSAREKLGIAPEDDLEFSLKSLIARQKLFPANHILATFENIWRGGLPDLQEKDEEQLGEYFNSYIETYLMRDAVDDYGIAATEGFRQFLRACAAFTGQLVNYNDLGASAGVSGVTAKDWVKILQSMGIVFLLEPYASNELKRLTKTPKLYFCDTGFCAYLSSWTSRDVLMNGAASGHYYENYVISELLRHYAYGRSKVNLNFYRDNKMKEIDLVIEENGVLHPVEIKKTASPDKSAVKAFSVLKRAERQVGNGAVICMSDMVLPLDESNFVVPSGIICRIPGNTVKGTPLMNAKRGYVPEDGRNFSPDALEKLRTASRHVRYLINEGYDLKHAVTFVGDHFLLSKRQRLAVMRSIATEAQLAARAAKEVPLTELSGREIRIDGFNTVITLEVLLSDSVLFSCMDGTVRDLAALRGTYRIIPETEAAVRLLLDVLKDASPGRVNILLDEPVSNSGRLKTLIAELGEGYPFPLDIRLLRDVDRELYEKENVVTSDSVILDRCQSWVNLAAECMRRTGRQGLRVWE